MSGALPRLERAYFPDALVLFAGFALHPGLRAAADIARQEIAAGLAVLGIGGGDRGDGAARARARIFPRLAGVLSPAAEQFADGDAREGEIGVGRQRARLLGGGRRRDR